MDLAVRANLVPPDRSLFILSGLTSHPDFQNVSMKRKEKMLSKLKSMEKCGVMTDLYMGVNCKCGFKTVNMKHNCDSKYCNICTKRRKTRITNHYSRFFDEYKVTKGKFFQFLTISPKNYDDIYEGYEDALQTYRKFMRRKYIKERIIASFYVIEVKNIGNGFNIHIHCVIYGRWLDYSLRGGCFECKQNRIRFNKQSKKFHCANRKCNSTNVYVKKDTKIINEWKDSGGSDVHIYGERVKSRYGAISYLTKYISSNKEDFTNNDDYIKYFICTSNRRAISATGEFYGKKIIIKQDCYCDKCGEIKQFVFDMELSKILNKTKVIPPDNERYVYV